MATMTTVMEMREETVTNGNFTVSKKKIALLAFIIANLSVMMLTFGGVELSDSTQYFNRAVTSESIIGNNKEDHYYKTHTFWNGNLTMMDLENLNSTTVMLKAPFTGVLAGPTGSGKTQFLYKLLRRRDRITDKKPIDVIYCYGAWQKEFEAFPDITFHEGLIDVKNDISDDGEHRWLIVDDLMDEAGKSSNLLNTFTKYSHHKNISVWFVTQNLFHKNLRSITINAHYIILFKNPRDQTVAMHLGRQLYPSNPLFLVEAYADATKDSYSNLFLDLKQTTPEFARVLGNFLSEDDAYPLISYIPK